MNRSLGSRYTAAAAQPQGAHPAEKPCLRGRGAALTLALLLIVEAAVAVFALSSSANMDSALSAERSRSVMTEFDFGVRNIMSDAVADIYEIPKAYVLPLVDEPAPVPDQACYSVVKDSGIATWNDTEVLRYEDDTTLVTVWREKLGGQVYNFADITIAHPSQLRRHLAGGEYCEDRIYPQNMAIDMNAVLAISGDFYNYRSGGVVVHCGKLCRNAPDEAMKEVLFVTTDGDFIIESCGAGFDAERYLEENDIMFSLSFGPAVINNGHLITEKEASDYPGEGWVAGMSPRTVVGQLGKLHYLFCTVDGRQKHSVGAGVHTIAEVMSERGCTVAYNLDGGNTATMVFGGEVFNKVAWGGQRHISDIIYIAAGK